MSIESEKEEILRLRFEEGLNLKEIAHKFGKSIYWVKSRLDSKYEPKRARKVAADETHLEIPTELEDETLSDEVKQIVELRKQGLSYEQIAGKLNRSVYWVHTRLRDAYRPRGTRAEKLFQEERVIPFLEQIGHKDIRQYVRIQGDGYDQEADVVSVFEDSTWITEVKTQITHHELQTAIGQLILHRTTFPSSRKPNLQIALPNEIDRRKLPKSLIDQLQENEDIIIVFIP